MRERPLSQSTFPAAHCGACGSTVLTHLAFDASGMMTRLCVTCDSPITHDISWITEAELGDTGHQIESPRRRGGCGGSCGCSIRGN